MWACCFCVDVHVLFCVGVCVCVCVHFCQNLVVSSLICSGPFILLLLFSSLKINNYRILAVVYDKVYAIIMTKLRDNQNANAIHRVDQLCMIYTTPLTPSLLPLPSHTHTRTHLSPSPLSLPFSLSRHHFCDEIRFSYSHHHNYHTYIHSCGE